MPKRKTAAKRRRAATKPSAPRKAQVRSDPYTPRGSDPLIKCKYCKVWSARRNYCSNCKEDRK